MLMNSKEIILKRLYEIKDILLENNDLDNNSLAIIGQELKEIEEILYK